METVATIREVRQAYEQYLKDLHPNWSLATLKTSLSRAFYLYSHHLVPSFWKLLESEESVKQTKSLLKLYLSTFYPHQAIDQKLSAYFCALLSLQKFMEAKGGVQQVILESYEAEKVLYHQAKLVFEERILMENEAALLTDEEEQALPEGAIELLEETLPFLEKREIKELMGWFLSLMNHTPFLLKKSQEIFYGVLFFFLEQIEKDYGKERLAQSLWTMQQSIRQSQAKSQNSFRDLRFVLEQIAHHYDIEMCFNQSIFDSNFQSDLPKLTSSLLVDEVNLKNSKQNALLAPSSIDFSLSKALISLQEKWHQEAAQKMSDPKPINQDQSWPAFRDEDFYQEVFLEPKQVQTLMTLLKRKKNIILQGPPGTGKNYTAKRLAYLMLQEKNEDLICSVQFHANYTYEDFVMGYRPTKTGFALRQGLFYTFCQKAKKDSRPHFFIIDEINRANVSKVFGELFSLLESDKRGQSLPLMYNKEPFEIPDNLYLIGLMNTADRSLSLIDYALRRRFGFFEMNPAFDTPSFKAYQQSLQNKKFDTLITNIQKLNQEISQDEMLGKGFMIGHSYFVSEQVNDEFLTSIVEFELIPLLKEYWIDEPDRVVYWSQNLRKAID